MDCNNNNVVVVAVTITIIIIIIIIIINDDDVEWLNLGFFTISSLRHKLCPTHILKMPGHNCVKIMCNFTTELHKFCPSYNLVKVIQTGIILDTSKQNHCWRADSTKKHFVQTLKVIPHSLKITTKVKAQILKRFFFVTLTGLFCSLSNMVNHHKSLGFYTLLYNRMNAQVPAVP